MTSITHDNAQSGTWAGWRYLPVFITLAIVVAMLLYGVVTQPANYHDFADHSSLSGLPHAADVLSNIGFFMVGLWGWRRLAGRWQHPQLQAGASGYQLLLISLMLTALGSGYYHLAPDDFRLAWDRLPIALACAGLVAGVRAETVARFNARSETLLLGAYAMLSVAWWYFSNGEGAGDLRPYLLLQILPILLIPLWQSFYRSASADRLYFGGALMMYIIAKFAELNDHALLAMSGLLSGHTLKHVLATLAAWLLVYRLVQRVSEK